VISTKLFHSLFLIFYWPQAETPACAHLTLRFKNHWYKIWRYDKSAAADAGFRVIAQKLNDFIATSKGSGLIAGKS